jgi:hypothetical protein
MDFSTRETNTGQVESSLKTPRNALEWQDLNNERKKFTINCLKHKKNSTIRTRLQSFRSRALHLVSRRVYKLQNT